MIEISPYLIHTNLINGLIDDFDQMNDLSASTFEAYKQYCKAVNNGDFVTASAIIERDNDLKSTIFNAEKYNCLRDAIIAIEENIVKDSILNLKGNWLSTEKYVFGDIVVYTIENQKYAYLCCRNNTPVGTVPTNDSYFVQLSYKGERGEKGEKGAELSFRGTYNQNTQYKKYDLVYSNGNTYWAKQDIKNIKPPNNSFWELFINLNVIDGEMIENMSITGRKLNGKITWKDLNSSEVEKTYAPINNLKLSIQSNDDYVSIKNINDNFIKIDENLNRYKDDKSNSFYRLGVEEGKLYIETI